VNHEALRRAAANGIISCTHTVHKQTGFSTEESLIYVCRYQSTVRPDGKDNGNRIRI